MRVILRAPAGRRSGASGSRANRRGFPLNPRRSDPDPADNPGAGHPARGAPDAVEEQSHGSWWLRAQAAQHRGQELVADLERRRPDSAAVETGFRLLARDKRIAGGILGGGLAYRFFFWFLGLSVLTSGALGLFARAGSDIENVLSEAGISQTLAEAGASVGDQSGAASLWLLLVGCFLVTWFGWGVLRALWLVHAAAWAIDPPPVRRVPQGVAGVVAVPFALVAIAALAGWIGAQIGLLPGVLATIMVGLVFGGFWVWVQTRLPSRDVPWTAFLPGTLAITAGFEAVHLFLVYFLAEKLESYSTLYGVLGVAATLLFVLFMLGRIIVWSAELNAVAWEVREERRYPEPGSRNRAAGVPAGPHDGGTP